MTALEFAMKGGLFSRRYALGLSMAPADGAALADELRLAKDALLEWVKKRGSSGTMIHMTFVVPASMDLQIRLTLDRLRTEEVDLAPILGNRQVLVAVLNDDGSPRLQWQLGQ